MDSSCLERLQTVLEAGVSADTLRAAADAVEALGEPLAIRIVPFVPGRRPARRMRRASSTRSPPPIAPA